ncbi:hypothetical protein [Streptomyces melanogenes]|uniref:Uncharacterized protein n=1 Tax=Streptomyces melanogenes TaxID=67326 RepID=A0ABZ1XBV4_9ACTN|nr:hypothetical protein [Streptomyces melanogenes]
MAIEDHARRPACTPDVHGPTQLPEFRGNLGPRHPAAHATESANPAQ